MRKDCSFIWYKEKKIDEKTYFDLLRLETRNGIICSTVPFLRAGHN